MHINNNGYSNLSLMKIINKYEKVSPNIIKDDNFNKREI